MCDFSDVVVGQKLLRVMKGLTEDTPWTFDAVVNNISDTEITCTVWMDMPRQMSFNRRTGISTNGKEYGWLQKSI